MFKTLSMKNKEIAGLLYEIAKLLDLKNENPFRVRSYEKAAQNIENLSEDVEKIIHENKLHNIPGIGKGIAQKIEEYFSKGKLEYYENLKKEFPEGLLKITSVPGIGSKTTKILYEKLGIKNINDLEIAVKSGKIRNIPHLGEKTEQNILRGIRLLHKEGKRILLSTGISLAKSILDELGKNAKIVKISPAGSLRRKKETIKDIDILCTSEKPQEVMKIFINLPQCKQILAHGETKSSIIIEGNIQVDLRVVEPDSYGAALQYFTGSKSHNIELRELANKKGYKINEYGLFEIKSDRKIAGRREKEIYEKLGLEWIPPELRESKGEIELAKIYNLPRLVEYSQIKGDLHIHSKWSDGTGSIEDIVKKAKHMGLKWIALCDHSQSLKIAHGMSPSEILRKIKVVKEFNKKSKDFKILCGTEVDILSDGSLDYKQELLEKLDFVLIAIHTGFKQEKDRMTYRITKAMENKYVHMFAHPTGRLLGKREPYMVDMDKIIEKASQTHTFLEINAYPERLDLSDIYCYKAKEKGILMGIGTDTHILDQMEYLPLGVSVARRGWLEPKNILNTLDYEELMKLLKRKR